MFGFCQVRFSLGLVQYIAALSTSLRGVLYKGPKIRYKVRTDYTKTQQTIQSPQKTIQRLKILDQDPKYQARTKHIKQE